MISRRFLWLSRQGIFWSGLRVALLTLLALAAKYLFEQYVAYRSQQFPRYENALAAIDDWSHHHLVFSQSSDLPFRLRLRLRKEPRFWNQRRMRAGAAIARLAASTGRPAGRAAGPGSGSAHGRGIAAAEFWRENLGADATVGPGNFPAKFLFNVAAVNCGNDFMVFNTRLMGTASQPSIAAFNHLYPGCHGAVPSAYWAYNTGGQVRTSVVLSPLGDQVAFVQSASGAASLVILKWASSGADTLANPVTLISNAETGTVPSAAYRTCTAPCMTTLAFSGNANDTLSSPFYDNANDAIYAGDDIGVLHKFENIFNGGVPAESGARFPVIVDRGQTLTSPVLDFLTGNVFVGDSGGYLSYVKTTGSSPGAVVRSRNLGAGIADAPIVDSTAARVYVFAANGTAPASPDSGVYQFTTGFSSGNAGAEQKFNPYNGGEAHFRGAFDDPYLTSAGASPTGSLFVCGAGYEPESKFVLYRFPVVENVIGAGSAVAADGASASPACYQAPEMFDSQGLVSGGKAEPVSGFADATSGSDSESGPLATPAGGAGRTVAGNSVPTIPAALPVHFVTLNSQLCAPSSGGAAGGCSVQAPPEAPQ